MGRKELEALLGVIQQQLASGPGNVLTGTWTIGFDREQQAFVFNKCEFGAYCEERPSVVALDGRVIDPGGPLLQDS